MPKVYLNLIAAPAPNNFVWTDISRATPFASAKDAADAIARIGGSLMGETTHLAFVNGKYFVALEQTNK